MYNSAAPSGPPSNRFNATLTHDSVDVMGRPLHQFMKCDAMTGDSSTVGVPCGSWMPYETSSRYNRLGEVVSQASRQYAGSATLTDVYHYDGSGNRDTLGHSGGTAHTTFYTYPSLSNRVSQSGDSVSGGMGRFNTTYFYDLAGSRTADSASSGIPQAYQYDAAGRMKGIVRVAPAEIIFPGGGYDTVVTDRQPNSCGYNADGLLVRGCGVVRVSYVGQNVVREHVGDWWYVVGPGLDEPLLAVKRELSGTVTQAWLPVVSDGRGQLIAIADSAGELSGTWVGPQFDAGLWNSSGLTSHSQSFNPRRWATPGGIDTISTVRSRQYDPATGKWLQEDPIGVAGGVNLYAYNGNDPNTFSDPFGLCPPADQNQADCPTHILPTPVERGITPLVSADPILLLLTGAADAVLGEAGAAAEGVADAVSISKHQAVDNIAREISPAMSRAAVRVGEKYLDAKHPSTIAHVVRGGLASGKDLYVVTDATATRVVTATPMRFNPATLFEGKPRWTPIQ